MLSGCAAGYTADGSSVRVDASGMKTISGEPGAWPGHDFGDGGRVWIERTGQAFVNDEMILERVAIALGISFDRTSPVAASRRAVETVIDAAAPLDRRMDAAAMLHLERESSYRVVAVPASVTLPGPSSVIYTGVGPVRAAIRRLSDAHPPDGQPGVRWGVGLAMVPGALDRSWASALFALRLTTPQNRCQLAEDLGSLLVFAELADSGRFEPPDLTALKLLLQSQPKALALLESLAPASSLRAVAEEVGLHHSSVQSRAADYSAALGFDLRTVPGRVRLSLVLTLYRLSTTTFGQ